MVRNIPSPPAPVLVPGDIPDRLLAQAPDSFQVLQQPEIAYYWRAEQDAEGAATIFRYRLDPTTGSYVPAGAHTGKMAVSEPVTVTIDLTGLH